MTLPILILALLLRLVLINQSLWLDEAIQALALMGKQGNLLTYALGDYQPPLYHLLGYLWTHLAGYSEFSLRSISLLTGFATVYFLIKIGRDFYSEKVGYIVGLLSATNPLLIYYSQEGRTYALTTFFVTASMYYFLKLINNHNHSKLCTMYYVLFTIAYLWTSYLSWFFFAALTLYTLYLKRYDLFKLQLASALTLLLWLPSFFESLNIGNSTRGNAPEWGRVVGGLSWKSLPLTWVKFVLGRISFVDKTLYAGIVLSLGALHLYVLTHLRRLITNYYLLIPIIIWLLAPIALGIIAASIIPIYQYFRVLFALPAYLLLLSLALSKFKSNLFPILLTTIQLSALAYFWFSPNLHRENWRQLVRDIPQSVTLAMPSRAQSAPLIYYGHSRPILEPSHEGINGKQIYYIRYVEDLFDTSKLGAQNFANSGYTITSQKVYSGLQVDIYENRD